MDENYTNLDPGTQIVEMRFLGLEIYLDGADGPYTVELSLRQGGGIFGGTIIDTDTHTVLGYQSTDFEPPGAWLLAPHSDYGLDTDADTLFNYLVVDVEVNVLESGTYRIESDLRAGFNHIGSDSNTTTLSVGIQTVELRFTGWIIYNSGEDGAYTVELDLHEAVIYGQFGNYIETDTDSHTTQAYLHTDFETPPATFLTPHSDHGLDTDGDTKFNYLVVDVVVNVEESGDYQIYGTLRDASFNQIGSDSNMTSLDIGVQTIELRFSSVKIHMNGEDGPYDVELRLYDDNWATLDSDSHSTQAYAYTDFDPPGAQFSSPHSDHGLDIDGDSYFDFLVVEVKVDVQEAGEYSVRGSLPFSGFTSSTATLGVGIQTVELRFLGGSIRYSDTNGPYSIWLRLYDADDNQLGEEDYHTQAYSYLDFETQGELCPPYSDHGSDVNGDSFFDYLVVEVDVRVNMSGTYLVVGNLMDSTFSIQITSYVVFINLNVGVQTVYLYFNGVHIFDSGIDGPYGVQLMLGIEYPQGALQLLGQDTYITNNYQFNQFSSSDNISPTVDYTTPSDGETGVSRTPQFYLVFSESMNQTSMESAFSYTDGVTTWDHTDGSFSCGMGSGFNMCTFYPYEPLTDDTTFTVTISTAAEDMHGNNLQSAYVFSFTVGTPSIQPPTGGNITGTVVDANGHAINGAEANLYNSTGDLVKTETTDNNGEFNFTSLSAGNYDIVVSKDGYLNGTDSATATSGTTTDAGTFTLTENGRISCTVKDDSGAPVPDATVELYQNGVQIKTTTTNSTGSFEFTNLTYGNYTIKVSKSGYENGEQKLELKNGADMTPELQMTINKLSSAGLGDYWWVFLIAALAIVGIAAVLLMRKRGKGTPQASSEEGGIQAAESEGVTEVPEEAAQFPLACANCGQALEQGYILCPNCGIKI
jgi:hypothetical protein